MGSVTITRANVIVAQPVVGDLVYQGDLIETGIDGLVSIVFVDGTTFRLYDRAHMVLDEFVFAAERSANSALFRVLKGRFSFFSGLLATTGRLMIDTAVARIQNTRPAAGIGGLAFSVFTIGLIHELNAASADIALLDDGTITCKDLKHGVFEIITKGDHPQRYVVDDPCVSIHFQIVGSQIRVAEVANTPGQMAQFHDAFLSTFDSYTRGQQDTLVQKWQHADVQPQSTPGSTGSSTSPTQLNNGSQVAQQGSGTQVASSGPSSGPSATPTVSAPATVATSTTTPTSVVPASTSSTTVNWISPSSGTWQTGQNWSTQAVPPATDTVQINLPLTVIVNAPESVASLVVGAGAIVDIVSGGALTVTTAIDNNGLVKINSSGTDPTLSIKGTVQLLDGGQIEMVGPATQNMIIGVAGSGATLVNVNNTIVAAARSGRATALSLWSMTAVVPSRHSTARSQLTPETLSVIPALLRWLPVGRCKSRTTSTIQEAYKSIAAERCCLQGSRSRAAASLIPVFLK